MSTGGGASAQRVPSGVHAPPPQGDEAPSTHVPRPSQVGAAKSVPPRHAAVPHEAPAGSGDQASRDDVGTQPRHGFDGFGVPAATQLKSIRQPLVTLLRQPTTGSHASAVHG
jgi:hypothetical protein